jgi:hypothetical protein
MAEGDEMAPQPDSDKPGDSYARALEDRIVRDADAHADAWETAGDPRVRVTPRVVVGLAIMIAGFVLALDSLGLVDGTVVFRYWPLALVAVGVVKWLSPPRHVGAGIVWIFAGFGFLLVTLGRMSFVGVWAMLLFFAGANIAWRALRPPVRRDSFAPGEGFDTVAVFGGTKTGSVSPAADTTTEFKGGSAMAVFGGCEIDLRHAVLPIGGAAVVDVFAMFGGIEIRVPEDWQVVNRGNAFMGGFENKSRPLPGAQKRLVVTGTAIMGGVEVKN